jgi:sugar fermentation stimulation protein A
VVSADVAVSVPLSEPVVIGRFIRRYKRFFVDVEVDGTTHTAHTANTGAMTGLLIERAPVLLTRHDKKTRSLPLELEAIHVGTSWVAVNTIRANRVAAAFVRGGVFPELGSEVTGTEVRIDDSRVDLMVGTRLVEVKSTTFRVGDEGAFPDARSERATKHADLLRTHAGRGAAIVLLAQRTDIEAVRPADEVDPAYGQALRRAAAAGVLVLSASVEVVVTGALAGLAFSRRLPVRL